MPAVGPMLLGPVSRDRDDEGLVSESAEVARPIVARLAGDQAPDLTGLWATST
jgi:hypothetical protein